MTPFQLYFNPTLIFRNFQVKSIRMMWNYSSYVLHNKCHTIFYTKLETVPFQLWRLFTCFCFFGTFGFSFLFNMIFTYRYCRMLEENSFRNKPADFCFMFLFGGAFMVVHIRSLSFGLQNTTITLVHLNRAPRVYYIKRELF